MLRELCEFSTAVVDPHEIERLIEKDRLRRLIRELNSFCYGESMSSSAAIVFEQAVQALRIKGGNFVDVGCGRGKMLALVCSLFNAEIFDKCLGVDVVENRIAESQNMLRAFVERRPQLAARIERDVRPQQGDIGNDALAETLLRNASMVYMYSICFNDELHETIVRQLLRNLRKDALVLVTVGTAKSLNDAWLRAIRDAQFVTVVAAQNSHIGEIELLKRI